MKASVISDSKHDGMWRVKFANASLSDMVNLTRANDAAARFNETVDREQRGRQKPAGRGYSDLNDERASTEQVA